MYDVPFLEASTSAAVVRPSRRLRRLALARSWDLTLDSVHSSRIEACPPSGPRAPAFKNDLLHPQQSDKSLALEGLRDKELLPHASTFAGKRAGMGK